MSAGRVRRRAESIDFAVGLLAPTFEPLNVSTGCLVRAMAANTALGPVTAECPGGAYHNPSLWDRWGDRAAFRYGLFGITYAWAVSYGHPTKLVSSMERFAVTASPNDLNGRKGLVVAARALADIANDVRLHREKHPLDTRSPVEQVASSWGHLCRLTADEHLAYVRGVLADYDDDLPVLGFPRDGN